MKKSTSKLRNTPADLVNLKKQFYEKYTVDELKQICNLLRLKNYKNIDFKPSLTNKILQYTCWKLNRGQQINIPNSPEQIFKDLYELIQLERKVYFD